MINKIIRVKGRVYIYIYIYINNIQTILTTTIYKLFTIAVYRPDVLFPL